MTGSPAPPGSGRPSGRQRPRPVRRLLTGPVGRLGLTASVIVAIFAFALPRLADYSEAWALVQSMSVPAALGVTTLALLNLLSYAALWVAALPGLGWRRAVLVEEASTAVSNTVPVGFAFGVGIIAAMYTSFGHSPGRITRAIAITGIWNNLVKLAAPVLALVALALTGERAGPLGLAAAAGLGVLVAVIVLLVAAVVRPGAARALGRAAQRAVTPLLFRLHRPAPSGWADRVDEFRGDARLLLRKRWPALTAAALGSHGLHFAVLLACVHVVGGTAGEVSWARVLAVFAITRLITIVPITPGAVGVAELSYVAGLVAVGVPAAAAAGAVLLFRFLTWFLPIPIGAVCWALWRRGVPRRRAVGGSGARTPR